MQFPDLPFEDAPDAPVSFHFEDVDFDLPDEQILSNWLLSVAAAEEQDFYEVNFIFCSDEHLRTINVDFLQHDYYTDIITFPLSEGHIHGDLFISADRVRENAQTEGSTFLHELCRVMVHGVLHLAGYGDKTPEEAATMRSKENEYLLRLPLIN